jgi:hypothetical protein
MLMDGEWDEDYFLTVPPGSSIGAEYDRKKVLKLI